LKGGSLTRRYVQPLFEVALEKDILDKITKDLKLLDDTLCSSPELKSFLNNPSIERRAKRDAIEIIFKDVSLYSMNFMRLIIDKNRIEVLLVAYSMFQEMIDIERGVIKGTVLSAVPVDDDLFKEIKRSLETRFDSKLELRRDVDPGILGGLRIQVGNTVMDASVKGRLERLKETLAGA